MSTRRPSTYDAQPESNTDPKQTRIPIAMAAVGEFQVGVLIVFVYVVVVIVVDDVYFVGI